jgi:cardiolipin synthase A/B
MAPSCTFRWLRKGDEAFAAMLDAINAAQKVVRFEMYIYTASPLGEKFREALVEARRRGARVRVLIDALGSMTLSQSFWEPLTKLGGEFRWFNPVSLRRWTYRNHRKVLTCDEAVAFIGGFNVASEYEGDGVERGWRDLGLQITGPLVQELAESFDAFYARADLPHKRLQRLRKAQNQIIGGRNWRLLSSGPGRGHRELRRTLVDDVAYAQSLKIICAYFLPTWRLRKELLRVHARGGRVQLILAGKSDVLLSQLASRRLYQSFLRRGVEIYEYEPQILHAKLFIMDDIVYVGSSNLDTRSLWINYELLVRISDPQVAAEARTIFDDDLRHCRRIDAKAWRKSRTFWSKLKERWAYFVLARLDPWMARRQGKTFQ